MKNRLTRRFLRSPRALIGLGILIFLTLIALFGPSILPHDPFKQNLLNRSAPPSMEHLLGTDQFGRDLLTRLVYGARISLASGVGAVLLGMIIGGLIGTLAGFYGGKVDTVLMAANDVFLGFRTYLLAILVVAILGTSILNLTVAIGLALFPQFSRLIRAEVLSVRNREFTEAARALGAGDLKILWKHVLPQTLSPMMVAATFYIATAIVVESSLSFLGLGPAPPTPSWGLMISDGLTFILGNYWLAVIPGIAIMITVLAFNLLGDAMRDIFDPRLKD